MAALALIAAIALGLLMIPFGMPGTLVIFGGVLCYYLLVPGGAIGLMTLITIGALMVFAEALDWVLAGRFARKYGGSKRAGWGAIIGGMVGAFLGVPVPIVGSIVGAFVGAFIGAFVFEWTGGAETRAAGRVAWGAFIGRVVAAFVKVGVGLAMAVWVIAALWLH
jgi:uncharacterized protein YqgC (DUF456 family)